LEQIADQLRAEIQSLAEYIQRTEERLQVTDWVSQLLDPFEHLEDGLSRANLQRVVSVLHQARYRFEVNGNLSGRIEAILDRHSDLIGAQRHQVENRADMESMPARDPAYPDLSADDEEIQDTVPLDPEGRAFQAFDFSADDEPFAVDELFPSAAAPAAEAAQTDPSMATAPPRKPDILTAPNADDPAPEPVSDAGGTPVASIPVDSVSEVEDAPAPLVRSSAASLPESDPSLSGAQSDDLPGTPDDLFSTWDDAALSVPEDAALSVPIRESESSPPTVRRADQELAAPDSASGSINDLFSDAPPSLSESPPPKRGSAKISTAETQDLAPEEPQQEGDLFAHKVSMEDLLLRLDITVPTRDRRQLENLLRSKITNRVVAALRTNTAFEKQFVLIPRLTRFIHGGQIYPCTVKNLARTFISLFGDIRDLIKYRDERFLDTEVPEQGWALITPEAPRESLNKSFMEQTQYLRYLSANLGVASHLVRRRTLVEAVYDCVVGRLVLGNTLQRQTLDWTSSSVGRNDYIGIYVSDSGIRLRELPRTTHNHALGTVATW
jgi:hypothetical protein